ncbi:amidase [Niallia nealsonii]|uniref:Amidase n=1 Tax=Niallia nealsonii TaxID=115979 RepID=A0A2N0Z0X4_9BACI|nr:amidase [Niallia nealsonii]PKG23159.1 amidase [Niallia nealsonii]
MDLLKRYTIEELNKGYLNKDFSPVEITKMYLEEIKEKNTTYNAFITITEENALKQAKYLEAKMMTTNDLSMLFGIPISYKDIIETKNILTTNGSFIDRNYVSKLNAPIVNTLNSQDTIMLGKNNLHEFAFGVTSNNPHYGAVRNPWNIEYTAGGSSGGSAAAVSANQSIISIGTDTGASIRVPAASCGVVGLKATKGRVSTQNVTGISWTLDHVGPIAANMKDLAIVSETILNEPFVEEMSNYNLKGLKIGVPKNYFNEKVDEESYTIFQKSLTQLEELGAILIEVEIPNINDNSIIGTTIALSEAYYLHRNNIENKISEYGEDVRQIMLASNSFSAHQYITALKRIKEYEIEFNRLFTKIDVLATLTMPSPPQRIGIDEIIIGGKTEDLFGYMCRNNYIFNMIGFPAVSLPCGLTKNNLPVGLQLVSFPYNEQILFNVGYSFESSFLKGFYEKRDTSLLALE